MGEIDPIYIQAVENRPKLEPAKEAAGIPLIDLSLLSSDDIPNPSSLEALVSEIREACENWGIFQVINHGVPSEKLQRLDSAARDFFHQPTEEKVKLRRSVMSPVGYMDSELTKNVKDWRETFDFTAAKPYLYPASTDPDDKEIKELINQWPDYPPQMREACEEYAEALVKLSFKLLELISLSLGLPAKRFNGFFKDHMSYVRINHYMPCLAPHLALGVGPHKDGGALTLLAQDDVGGLEVKPKTGGEWIRVKPTPNAYVIFLGEMFQVWTNDKYTSLEHRAVANSQKERLSFPLFFLPSHYVNTEPLEELTSEQDPPKYKAFNWGKFFAIRKRDVFGKRDVKLLLIDDLRISK